LGEGEYGVVLGIMDFRRQQASEVFTKYCGNIQIEIVVLPGLLVVSIQKFMQEAVFAWVIIGQS
jgi:hypothetical protein